MGVVQDFRLLENDLTVEFKIDIYISLLVIGRCLGSSRNVVYNN